MDAHNIPNIYSPPAPEMLGESRKEMLLNGRYSDMEIECENFTFKVHRNIVCSQSDFFKAAMKGGFAVSGNDLRVCITY